MTQPRFQGHGVILRPMNALDVLCARLTCDLFAIAKLLYLLSRRNTFVGGKCALPSALLVQRFNDRCTATEYVMLTWTDLQIRQFGL